MIQMRRNILKILCFTTISAVIDYSLQLKMNDTFFESEFQLKPPVIFKCDSLDDCKINLKGNSLEFECNEYLNKREILKFVDDGNDLCSMLYTFREDGHDMRCAVSQHFLQGCFFNNCNKRNVRKLIVFRDGDFNNTYKHLPVWYENKCFEIENVIYNYMKNMNSICQCSGNNFIYLTQVKELRIVMNMIDLSFVRYYYLPNENVLRGMENLEVFELKFQSKDSGDFIVKQQFKGLTKLSTLRFMNCNISLLTENNFQDLVNLKSMKVQGGFNNHDKWLSFQIIRDKLMFLELDEGVLNHKPNITAFICTNSSYCDFNVDIQKKPCPIGCDCYLNRSNLQFIIDCDRIEIGKEIPELPIPITGNTSLYFNNRSLTQLPFSNVYGYSKIKELHVANNKLSSLTVDQLPENLTYLDLRNNSIQSLDHKVLEYFLKRAGTISVKLSNNPWLCNCDLFKLLTNWTFIIGDRDQIRIKCLEQNNGLWILLLNVGFCKPYFHVIFGLLLGFVVVVFTFCCFKKSIMMWLYERNLCLFWAYSPEPKADIVLKIDAFLAFSHKDLQLVEEFVEKLEKGPREYQLCFYQRDWLIGESIPACILNSIEDSKRIIILMTNNFINSSWGLFEFRTAIKATSMNKEKRMIVILYPGVDIDRLDSELKIYMKYNTYLRRDDPLFWRKLIFAMPHKQRNCEYSN